MASYVKYSNFCPQYTSNSNPYILSLLSDVDKSFEIGDQGATYGPKFKNSQLLIGQYIASHSTNWDMICEIASTLEGVGATLAFNPTKRLLSEDEMNMTFGEIFLTTAAYMKYARYEGCKVLIFPFDPTNPSSPCVMDVIADYNSTTPKAIFDGVNPEEIDKDVLMDKLLEKPYVFYRILLSIYSTSKNMGKDLSKTKLGKFFENNKQFFS